MRQTTLLNPEHLVVFMAEPISHTGNQNMDFVEIFNISLDLPTIYVAHFSGCWASFEYSCHSISECKKLVFWSLVEYKTVLFYFIKSLTLPDFINCSFRPSTSPSIKDCLSSVNDNK